MIKKNLFMIIVTTLITLLPALLVKSMMPLLLVVVHLLCVFFTAKDKGNQEQNPKVFRLVLWICPIIAIYTTGLNYLVITGRYSGIEEISIGLFGLLFIVIGNYLPKCKMNATIGIRIPWTYSSEENWRRTHRFGGKIWMICGLLILCTVFMPANISGIVLVSLFFVMIIVPTVYSWLFYRKEVKEGKASLAAMLNFGTNNKKKGKTAGLSLIVIFVFVAILMFTGNIEFSCGEEELSIKADFWGDMTIDYDEIENIEYLENDTSGSRTNGYGSARLLMGTFRNEEFDYYTRYSYTKCDSGIMLDLGKSIVVISDIDDKNTQKLYEELLEKVN